jgi:hypothetical protein
VGRDNFGIIITGNENVVRVERAPATGPKEYLERGRRYLQLGHYARALDDFKCAIDGAATADGYYLCAVATLSGRKAFLAPLSGIREAEMFLRAAVRLEDRGIFHYFLAYLGFEYYERKSLRSPTPWRRSLMEARNRGVTQEEISTLFRLLTVANPLPIQA